MRCIHCLYFTANALARVITHMAEEEFRQTEGKASRVYATPEGEALRQPIKDAWKRLHQRYTNVLGLAEGDRLVMMIDGASDKLSAEC